MCSLEGTRSWPITFSYFYKFRGSVHVRLGIFLLKLICLDRFILSYLLKWLYQIAFNCFSTCHFSFYDIALCFITPLVDNFILFQRCAEYFIF